MKNYAIVIGLSLLIILTTNMSLTNVKKENSRLNDKVAELQLSNNELKEINNNLVIDYKDIVKRIELLNSKLLLVEKETSTLKSELSSDNVIAEREIDKIKATEDYNAKFNKLFGKQ